MLLDDILTVGRLENGKVDCNPKNLNVKLFFDKIVETIIKSGRNTHLIDLSEIPENLMFFVDEKLAINIFNNLLTNAVKFSPNAQKIEVKVNETIDGVNITIIDFGIGISKSDLEKIFEPFQRGQNVETIQGTGLGLAIVKNSVELHGGFIKIDSILDKGTTILICLPKENIKNDLHDNL